MCCFDTDVNILFYFIWTEWDCVLQEQVLTTGSLQVHETLLAGHLGVTRELVARQSEQKKYNIGSEHSGQYLIMVSLLPTPTPPHSPSRVTVMSCISDSLTKITDKLIKWSLRSFTFMCLIYANWIISWRVRSICILTRISKHCNFLWARSFYTLHVISSLLTQQAKPANVSGAPGFHHKGD